MVNHPRKRCYSQIGNSQSGYGPSHIDLVGAEIEMINYPDRESVLKAYSGAIRKTMILSLSTVPLPWV